jgi:hypothetical protein
MIHETAEQLHRHILEGERRTMEKLENEKVVAQLRQGADGGMPEGGISLINHAPKLRLRDVALDQRPQYGLRNTRIRLPGKALDRIGCQYRPAFGHIEATIPRQTGKQGIGKAKRGGFSPGRDMEHCQSPGISAGQ